MQQHKIGPWLFVKACQPMSVGREQVFTFVRAHEADPRRAIDLRRGYGQSEAEAVRDAARRLVDDRGLPLFKNKGDY